MTLNKKPVSMLIVLLTYSLLLSGCATLAVTPLQTVKTGLAKQPVNVGIQVSGDRLREALNDPHESAAGAASGRLFDKVALLPKELRTASPTEIRSSSGADYILTGTLSDFSVSGNLNPYWFAAIPLLFFKPYAPIVTFEATVSIETSLVEAQTGATLLRKEISATSTDHFSPVEPREKVRGLVARSINNAFLTLLEEVRQKVSEKR